MDHHGRIVERVNMIDQLVRGGFQSNQAAVAHAVERPLDVARSERAAIMKTNAMAKMEDVGARVGHVPLLGQPRLDVEMLITMHQRIEDQLINALRLGVGADTRIKIGGTKLNDHHQRVGRGMMGAGNQKQE